MENRCLSNNIKGEDTNLVRNFGLDRDEEPVRSFGYLIPRPERHGEVAYEVWCYHYPLHEDRFHRIISYGTS